MPEPPDEPIDLLLVESSNRARTPSALLSKLPFIITSTTETVGRIVVRRGLLFLLRVGR